MKARVTTEFSGRPDDAASARVIAVGESIDGELAEVAMREGWACEITDAPAEDRTETAKRAASRKPGRR